MSIRLGLFAFYVLLPACSGCSGCSESAETDSQRRDVEAGIEAGPVADARADALKDVLSQDSFEDSFEDSVDVQDGASAVPTWTLLPGKAAGCPIERIANPEQVRLFTWTACEGVPDCERAVITEGVLPYGSDYQAWGPACTVSDQTGIVRLGMVQAGLGEVFFAFEDGTVFDGYRPVPGYHCGTGGSAMWGDRYGVPILAYPDGGVKAGGVLHFVGSSAEPLLFTLPPLPGGPQATWMGSERWAWWWVLPESLISMSTSDGGDATVFAPTNPSVGPVVALGQATTAGAQFLFQERVVPEGGPYTARIAASDGKQPPIPYLVPPTDSHYGAVAFAGTHVAWMRGISPQGINDFERVEIWASPYDPDPSKLNPVKIGDWPDTHLSASSHMGGHGKYAAQYAVQDKPMIVREVVWDLNTKTSKTFQLPQEVVVMWPVGITEKYVWGVGGPRKAGDTAWLMRFKVD